MDQLKLSKGLNSITSVTAEIKIYHFDKFDGSHELKQNLRLLENEIIMTFDVSEQANFLIVGTRSGKLIYYKVSRWYKEIGRFVQISDELFN